jgi:hypothetical protein
MRGEKLAPGRLSDSFCGRIDPMLFEDVGNRTSTDDVAEIT